MEEKIKEKKLKKLVEILNESFSDKELRKIKGFLARIAKLPIEARLDGDLPE